jgi:hypothetical protein
VQSAPPPPPRRDPSADVHDAERRRSLTRPALEASFRPPGPAHAGRPAETGRRRGTRRPRASRLAISGGDQDVEPPGRPRRCEPACREASARAARPDARLRDARLRRHWPSRSRGLRDGRRLQEPGASACACARSSA